MAAIVGSPGILVMAVAGAPPLIAISISLDLTKGTATRFRAVTISRAAILRGHVGGGLAQTLTGLVIVIGITVLLGRGLVAKHVGTARKLPLPLVPLPILGSGFVPTDSMPAGLGWFAEYQLSTPIIEAPGGLLMGTPIGNRAILALARCVAIARAGRVWSMKLSNREPVRSDSRTSDAGVFAVLMLESSRHEGRGPAASVRATTPRRIYAAVAASLTLV